MALSKDNSAVAALGDGREATAARMAATPPKEVPALTRGIAVLRLLGRSEEPLGVNAVARQLGLVPSTCLHILRVLVAEGLVAFDAGSKRYGLDAGVLGLARGYLARPNFAALVQPGLDELARRHGVIAIGARVLGLQHFTVVALSRSEEPIRLHIDVGRRFPALISATGRCVAAFSGRPLAELEARFQQLRWDNAPSLRVWRRQVRETGERGYSVDEGHYISGVTVVAAPVLDAARRMTHGVAAVALSDQVRRAGLARLVAGVCQVAGAAAARLRSRESAA